MASASILYPQNSEYYYYKEFSGGIKKYFSVDGQNVHVKHIEKIITSIQNYEPAFMKYHVQKEIQQKKEEIAKLRRKKEKLENILKEIPKENIVTADYQKDLLIFYYIKNGSIFDYRKYISDTIKKKLKEFVIMEEQPCYTIPINIPMYKIEKENSELKEKFSRTNTILLLQSRIEELENGQNSIQKHIKELYSKIEKFRHISAINVEKLVLLYQKEKEILNFFHKKESYDKEDVSSFSGKRNFSYHTSSELLISLGIKDKQTFRLWIKKNHPDKHQQSKDIEHITKLFTEVMQAGRQKGYLSNGMRN